MASSPHEAGAQPVPTPKLPASYFFTEPCSIRDNFANQAVPLTSAEYEPRLHPSRMSDTLVVVKSSVTLVHPWVFWMGADWPSRSRPTTLAATRKHAPYGAFFVA